MIGQTISHYKILEKLGEGGMGVVYKAQDTKLDRTVALKFLPAHGSINDDTKARFMQEAKAAAALNHANICTIHGMEEDGGQMFIVMEYIEGGTLREKIPFKKLDDAISVAAQIGDALHEAHAKGIVHRDIKADNIMLTSKGQAKVMDFGLAKLKGSLKLTKTSSTVGTLGYMAPEQIQGGTVDHRSDIFSYGVLLFEMLTGKLPFRGEHEAAMVYSIVNEEPEPLQKYLPDTSPDLIHILSRALEKDPEDRYQSVADMVSELRRLLKQSSRIVRRSAAAIPAPHDTSSVLSRKGFLPVQNRKMFLLAAIGLVLAAILLFALIRPWTGSVRLNPDMTTRVLEIPFVDIEYPGLSGDGNWAAFPARSADENWRLYFMNTSGGEPRAITSEAYSYLGSADVSSDGSKAVYFAVSPGAQTPDIFLTSALGGGSRVIAQKGVFPRWRPDGKRVFFIRGLYWDVPSTSGDLEVWSVSPDGVDERLEFIDSVTIARRFSLSVSPDSRSVAWIRTFPEGEYQEIMIRDLGTGRERQITFDRKNIDEVCWASNGQILYSSNKSGNTNLWMIPDAGGTPVQITSGTGPDLGMKISGDARKLLYYQSQFIGDFFIGSLQTGVAQRMTYDDRIKYGPALSPDGTLLAFVMGSSDALRQEFSIYVSNRDGTNRRKISPGEKASFRPLWSLDGKYLAYMVPDTGAVQDSAGSAKTFVTEVHTPGDPRFVATGRPFLWLDRENLIVHSQTATWLTSIKTGEVTQFFEDSTNAFPAAGNRYVCFKDLRFGREGWWVVQVNDARIPAGKPQKILDVFDVASSPFGRTAFSPLRDFIMYFDSSGSLWKVHLPGGQRERGRHAFAGLTAPYDFSLNPQTSEIIYTRLRFHGKLVMIEDPFRD